MQKIAFFFAILIIGGIATSLCAQPGKHPKWDTALLALEKSDFVVQYSAIKDTIELQIADFHRQKSGLRPEEIAAVKKGYEQSVEQFNKVLNLIKEDFTDPSYRSFMADHPDRFSATLEAELNNALTFYNNNCKSKIDQYVPHGHASLGLMEVGMLITLGKELYKIWSERQAKAKEMSGSYFEERFVSKYRLKKWDHY
jgi:hypothetical protein